MVLPQVFALRDEIGEDRLMARMTELSRTARDAMVPSGLQAVTPKHPELCGAMIAYAIPQVDVIRLWLWLRDEHGMEVAFPYLAGGRALLRISTAWWTATEDVERLAGILRDLDWDAFKTGAHNWA